MHAQVKNTTGEDWSHVILRLAAKELQIESKVSEEDVRRGAARAPASSAMNMQQRMMQNCMDS